MTLTGPTNTTLPASKHGQSAAGGFPLAEVQQAIQAAYPYDDGQMVIRHVSSRNGMSWYRVNWYRSSRDGLFIDRSRFLALRRTADGLVVEDQTITSRTTASVN
jgi:hypothetical protein